MAAMPRAALLGWYSFLPAMLTLFISVLERIRWCTDVLKKRKVPCILQPTCSRRPFCAHTQQRRWSTAGKPAPRSECSISSAGRCECHPEPAQFFQCTPCRLSPPCQCIHERKIRLKESQMFESVILNENIFWKLCDLPDGSQHLTEPCPSSLAFESNNQWPPSPAPVRAAGKIQMGQILMRGYQSIINKLVYKPWVVHEGKQGLIKIDKCILLLS